MVLYFEAKHNEFEYVDRPDSGGKRDALTVELTVNASRRDCGL